MTHYSNIRQELFQTTIDGKRTDLYRLSNKNGIELSVTDFGARIVDLWTPDRNGKFQDIVLGHDDLDSYHHYKGERFFGATIGRFGNRIAKGRFSLNGQEYSLPTNDGPNSLHGGSKGFDMVVWDVVEADNRHILLRYISEDGEEGYPGTLETTLEYRLTDENELVVTHQAKTDKKTVINLTHHSFFNLHGAGEGSINDHYLTINAGHFTPVDETLIPTGEIAPVEGTPMDFKTPTLIGERVDDDFEQLHLGRGYDHNWVLDRKTESGLEFAAELYEPESGRSIEVFTTEPGIQFYGGNFLDGARCKGGMSYDYRSAVALETQHFPDSPNHDNFPTTVLGPGEEYRHICIYKFGIKNR